MLFLFVSIISYENIYQFMIGCQDDNYLLSKWCLKSVAQPHYEPFGFLFSEVCVQREFHVLGLGHDSRLLVLADALLEEVGLALERDVVHEVHCMAHSAFLLTAGAV